MVTVVAIMQVIGFASLAVAAAYALLTLVAMLVWRTQASSAGAPGLSPVSVLKPLCGAEPGLYQHLRSFCRQDYPQFQLVFGVRDPADAALAVVRRLVAEFPAQPIDVVIDPQQHGSNAKVSNLINMIARARHDLLVMADSDTRVAPDYLAAVTAPLRDRSVGLVTCLYRGVPTRQIWSRLGAMYINDWYAPSVLLAWLFGYQGYVSGQTICLRRDTLQAIGGLRQTASHLADDHRLGELVRALGLRIVLSHYWLTAEHDEPSLRSLIGHELRWMRTIRVLRPKSFPGMFLTFSLPLAALGLALIAVDQPFSPIAWALFVTTLLARLALHLVHRRRGAGSLLSDCWLLPVRDLLILWVWCRSLLGSQVSWRGNQFAVDHDGILHRRS